MQPQTWNGLALIKNTRQGRRSSWLPPLLVLPNTTLLSARNSLPLFISQIHTSWTRPDLAQHVSHRSRVQRVLVSTDQNIRQESQSLITQNTAIWTPRACAARGREAILIIICCGPYPVSMNQLSNWRPNRSGKFRCAAGQSVIAGWGRKDIIAMKLYATNRTKWKFHHIHHSQSTERNI